MFSVFLAALISVTDGDTFKARVEVWPSVEVVTSIRIVGIDTPELKGKCVAERALAVKAKARLEEILKGKEILIAEVKPDKYSGRYDAYVTADREDVGGILLEEGLARPYTGGPRGSWCP